MKMCCDVPRILNTRAAR